jgi:hypothetical protein
MKQINNIFSWCLLKDELQYIDRDHKQFCVDFLNNAAPEKYDLSYEPFIFFQVPDNGSVIVDDGNRPSSIYKENKLMPFEMKEVGSMVNQEQDPEFPVFFKTENGKKTYKVFDWRKNQVTIEAKNSITIVKDKALCIIGELLHCYSLNGQLNWQHDLASGSKGKEQAEVKKFIGLYEQKLWMLLKDNSLLVLDTVTGKQLFAPMNLKETLKLTALTIGDMQLDEKSGRIKVLAFSYYIEIDLATYTPEIKKKHEEGWSIGRGRFYEDDVRAYFTADYPMNGKSIGNGATGIFNTETLEIEWHYTLSGEDKYHFFVNQPQANEKYFVVKDSNETLYLFER